jgi:hypothetical protein
MPRSHRLILGEHEPDFLDQLEGEDELPDDEPDEEGE